MAGDVTNPDSWRLVGEGGDLRLDTLDCSVLEGDDEALVISGRHSGTRCSREPTGVVAPASSHRTRRLKRGSPGSNVPACSTVPTAQDRSSRLRLPLRAGEIPPCQVLAHICERGLNLCQIEQIAVRAPLWGMTGC